MQQNLPTPESQDVVIVGITGDLSRRKLLPALYNLWRADLLPAGGRIVGMARGDLSTEELRQSAHDAVKQFSRTGLNEDGWPEFAERLRFLRLQDGAFEKLSGECDEACRLVYLATPPDAVPGIAEQLYKAGLHPGTRLVCEKPFGHDLESARELNARLHQYFGEDQIFRIDHYLGKETVQNILVFRFANGVFERVWNRDAIQHIEITVAESIGMEGRGAFYEQVGALRDILQNHVLQMLAVVTMEAPPSFDAEAIRDEKAKLLRSVRPLRPEDTVRGQYTEGVVNEERVGAYAEEKGVRKNSDTETFVATKLYIDNWRWAGVPVYLRTGKRLPHRSTQIEIEFKGVPQLYFHDVATEPNPNHLTLRIQPEQEIVFDFLAKEPGPELDVKPVAMSFSADKTFMVEPAEAYERLIHDVMLGDHTLFVREDAVEQAWKAVEPLLDSPPPLTYYPAGSWGPEEADALVAPERWHAT